MKNKFLFLLFGLVFLAGVLTFVSANDVCCGKVINGPWCQVADSSQCDSAYGGGAPTSCDNAPYCILGTCINENTGQCSPNTPKVSCESQGQYAQWDPRPSSEIAQCQLGCCQYGENVAFTSQVECNQIASDYSVDVDFLASVTDELECYALAQPDVEGACVYEEIPGSLDCKMLTKEECTNVEGSSFEEGFLCSAIGLGTNCAKSKETLIYNGQVYYKDTCGNKANIYDASKYNDVPYWETIQEPFCSVDLSNPSSLKNCGNCNEVEGTIASEYKIGQGMQKPTYGNNVCRDLGCSYDTDGDGNDEYYKHGETWCAKSEGVFWSQSNYNQYGMGGIMIDGNTAEFINGLTSDDVFDYSQFNLPGSRYYQLSCIDGEVINTPCADFRNEVCMESTYPNSDFRIGTCEPNDWRLCFNETNKNDCESGSPQYCKWVEGYRYDLQDKNTKTELNPNEQGSCVPLYAPGFDFWNPESNASLICAQATVQENTLYETSWANSRDNFEDDDPKDQAHRCIDNCYSIPGYGEDLSESELLDIYEGNLYIKGKFVSYRRGYYCEGKTGEVTGSDGVVCAQDSSNRNIFPEFLSHESWIDSLRTRARSLGDCGYKPGAFVDIADVNPEVEIVTAVFQKLKQDGSPKSDDPKGAEKIYVGDKYIGDKGSSGSSGSSSSSNSNSISCSNLGGTCVTGTSDDCAGQVASGANCPTGTVCCVNN
ncbi:MAG: hypothetical protein KC516_03425 [Nanoarchaeota archaeon]|nr:hypothetical protein [Nanoarchaeota archaeon]